VLKEGAEPPPNGDGVLAPNMDGPVVPNRDELLLPKAGAELAAEALDPKPEKPPKPPARESMRTSSLVSEGRLSFSRRRAHAKVMHG